MFAGDRHRLGIGWTVHSRTDQRSHRFKFPLFMPVLDLDDLPNAFSRSRFWSLEKRNLAAFFRADHFGTPSNSLADEVRRRVSTELGCDLPARVLMAAHLRYAGYVFNPITLYFCLDGDNRPMAMLAEVNNIPWGESVCYAMPLDSTSRSWTHRNDKQMHVSPFLPMNMEYRWKIQYDDEAGRLTVNIANWKDGRKFFNAALDLRLEPLNAASMRRVLWRYPVQTLQVVAGIHWHALRLKLKGVKYIPHSVQPKQINPVPTTSGGKA